MWINNLYINICFAFLIDRKYVVCEFFFEREFLSQKIFGKNFRVRYWEYAKNSLWSSGKAEFKLSFWRKRVDRTSRWKKLEYKWEIWVREKAYVANFPLYIKELYSRTENDKGLYFWQYPSSFYILEGVFNV